mmetsp:Transcript_66445/g.131038  ORF Transcript_66445/g.131038 Transcript_66445/m.131038 type:complete len:85 (+) Transcript_66445:153-407(+)
MHQERFTALNKSCPFLDNAGHHLSSAALSLQLGSTSGKNKREAGRAWTILDSSLRCPFGMSVLSWRPCEALASASAMRARVLEA